MKELRICTASDQAPGYSDILRYTVDLDGAGPCSCVWNFFDLILFLPIASRRDAVGKPRFRFSRRKLHEQGIAQYRGVYTTQTYSTWLPFCPFRLPANLRACGCGTGRCCCVGRMWWRVVAVACARVMSEWRCPSSRPRSRPSCVAPLGRVDLA